MPNQIIHLHLGFFFMQPSLLLRISGLGELGLNVVELVQGSKGLEEEGIGIEPSLKPMIAKNPDLS
ncbi:MAG: hypothetical protein HPY81_09610 [Firmicutes bacterium]|nr:hypothetical protein [Bacillota bacterium]